MRVREVLFRSLRTSVRGIFEGQALPVPSQTYVLPDSCQCAPLPYQPHTQRALETQTGRASEEVGRDRRGLLLGPERVPGTD